MKNKIQAVKFLTLVVFLILAVVAVKYFGVSSVLHPAMIKEKILAFGTLAPLAYLIIYAVATVALIPGAPLTIAGGALFGSLFGTLYTVVAASVGAVLAFLLSRALGRDFVGSVEGKQENQIAKKLGEYDKKIEENGIGVVLFLRFVPLFPFNGLNFALGLTKVTFEDYFWGTLFGIIPGTFAYVYLGESLASLSVWNIFGAVFILALLSFGATFLKKHKTKT